MADKDFWSQFESSDNVINNKSVEHEHLQKNSKKSDSIMFNNTLSQLPQLQSAANNPLVKYGGATGIGLIQGAINNASSIYNIPSDVINMAGGNVARIPTPDLSKYAPQDPYSQAFEKSGEIGGEIGSGLGSYKLAGNLLGIGPEAPVYKRAAQGALTGFAEGATDSNSAYNLPSGRILGAITGGALGSIGQLSNKSLADRLAAIRNREKKTASEGYNSLFDTIKERGFSDKNLNIPSFNPEDIRKSLSAKYRPSFDRFMSKPTIENAHKAQSDIGKMINDIYMKKGGLTSSQIDSYPFLQDSQKRLRGNMLTHLVRNDSGDLANLYHGLTKNYAENVSPYNIDELKRYASNRKEPSTVIKEIFSKRNEPFMLSKGKNIPALKARQSINNIFNNEIARYLLGGAAGAGASMGIYDLMRGNG